MHSSWKIASFNPNFRRRADYTPQFLGRPNACSENRDVMLTRRRKPVWFSLERADSTEVYNTNQLAPRPLHQDWLVGHRWCRIVCQCHDVWKRDRWADAKILIFDQARSCQCLICVWFDGNWGAASEVGVGLRFLRGTTTMLCATQLWQRKLQVEFIHDSPRARTRNTTNS